MFDYSGYRNNQKSDTHKRHADNKSCHKRAYGENRKSAYVPDHRHTRGIRRARRGAFRQQKGVTTAGKEHCGEGQL